jgi:hypothetical protein
VTLHTVSFDNLPNQTISVPVAIMNDYEQLRCSNIKRNQEYLDSLGISKDIIPARSIIKKNKIKILKNDETISRKSKRLRDIDDEEPIISINKLEEYNFYAPVELQEVRRCRIDAISLRNYIANSNKIHNDFISETV